MTEEGAHYGVASVDWEHTRRFKIAPVPGPPDWPAHVQPISLEGLALLGLDQQGSLYWDGKPVEVRQSLALTRGQKAIAGLVVAFTILGGLGSMLQGAVVAHQWGCQTKAWFKGCPASQ
ncbi:hypothetical protein [Methylobacterium sp. J-070]|uniref:hypothetical protein n=1 Tax=Methylobacterium sp. J-070 TaxID=2836650 RepID=UPI001FB96ADC|nr:hypothetical protein [Methylobacterium sp. J-070]MCJ2054766.1 hypothetical protein [Methylobacterium sp. J-070]